jgi:hypothetical protein
MLVCYPHGLGDCILLTPALREYYFLTGKKASVATLERFKTAKLFDSNPYVDKIFYTKDAWNDYPNFDIGCREVHQACADFAKHNNIENIAFPQHKSYKEKILANYVDIGLERAINPSTELYSTSAEVERATGLISELVKDSRFGFIQTKTGVPAKDLPEGYGRKWLKKNCNLTHFIEVGIEYDGLSMTIGTQFEIMRRASGVCLPDSVFYHACGAMNKPVDFVFFAKGKSVYDRVRPLHPTNQNIKYKLDEI